MSEDKGVMRLRAHHICCAKMTTLSNFDRGPVFAQQQQSIKAALESETASIQVVEGVDSLCATCVDCKENKCASARGGDEGVRKWDAILLRELGITYNTTMPASEWRTLLASKRPFQLCARCSYRTICEAL